MRRGWLLAIAACGRIGFDASSVTTGDASSSDGARDAPVSHDASVTSSISWSKTFAARSVTATLSDVFTASVEHAGDAVVMQVFCGDATISGIQIAAAGWTFVNLGGLSSNPYGSFTTVAAIAPNTLPGSFDVMIVGGNGSGCGTIVELGDAFTGNDPTGGTTTFTVGGQSGGTSGTCNDSVTTGGANDAVWAACTAVCNANDPGDGYTLAANNGACGYSEYAITTDPAGTNETPAFKGAVANWSMSAVAIKAK